MSRMVNFKAFLTRADGAGKPEIRRFVIDLDVVSNYVYLREKLQTVFPELKGKLFTVTWKDEDGDDIVISNCEELNIALTEMETFPVRKLYVVLQSIVEEKQRAPREEVGPTDAQLHVGVVCDACEQRVSGFRYKCLQCLDYDLCSSCESKGFHPEHCMLRISTPQQWRAHHGKQLSYYLSKLLKKSCPFEEGRRHSHKSKRHGDERHCGKPAWSGFGLGPFATYLNDWSNLAGATNKESTQEKQEQPSRTEAPTFAPTHDAAGPSSSNMPSYATAPTSDDKYNEYLKNIGETVSQFLDPLGINVNIQHIRPKTDKPEEANEKNQDNVNFNDLEVPDVEENTSAASSTVGNQEDQLLDSDGKSNKNDGWTLVDNIEDPSPSISIAPSAPPSGANSNKESVAPSRENSPGLQKKEVYPNLAEVTQSFKHENPQVQTAVESLLQMGFSNEGGWLTTLVVMKNGDINKILDVLQPAQR